jgi:protein subunit release factor A
MFDKLQDIATQYQTLQHKLYDPEVLGDVTQLTQINRKITSMQELYDTYQQYQKCHHAQQEAKAILETEEDPDLIQMAQEQRDQANQQMPLLEQQLKILMLPKDPNDDKNIFLEIRPAAGGDEAGLFGSELLKMYMMYAQSQWWKAEIIEHILNDVWWLKFAMIKINGNKVYSIMKYESGVHRVQRIPATETNGRVHTSTVTVAIMPEAEEIDFHIDPKEVEMDTYAASSAGGQMQTKIKLESDSDIYLPVWWSISEIANHRWQTKKKHELCSEPDYTRSTKTNNKHRPRISEEVKSVLEKDQKKSEHTIILKTEWQIIASISLDPIYLSLWWVRSIISSTMLSFISRLNNFSHTPSTNIWIYTQIFIDRLDKIIYIIVSQSYSHGKDVTWACPMTKKISYWTHKSY